MSPLWIVVITAVSEYVVIGMVAVLFNLRGMKLYFDPTEGPLFRIVFYFLSVLTWPVWISWKE